MNEILMRQVYFQIFELFHPVKGTIVNPYIVPAQMLPLSRK